MDDLASPARSWHGLSRADYRLAPTVLAPRAPLAYLKAIMRSYRHGRVAAVVLALGASWISSGSRALAEVPEAKSHYDRAIVQYNLGHFQDAIAEFEKAYEIDPAPVLLFNLAQAHRQAGNIERAIFFYKRFLASDPNSKKRADVEKRIRELEELAQKQAEVKSKPPSGPEPESGPTARAPESETSVSPPATTAPPQPAKPGSSERPFQDSGVTPAAASAQERPDRGAVFVSGGPALAQFGGSSVASKTIASVEIGGRLAVVSAQPRVELLISGGVAPVPYDGTSGVATSLWISGWGGGRISYRLSSAIDLFADLAGGVVWWTGLEEGNPFTVQGMAATGAVPMPSFRAGPGVAFEPARHVSLALAPRYVMSKTSGPGLSAMVSSVARLEIPVEVTYNF
jgi:hypothetical protein